MVSQVSVMKENVSAYNVPRFFILDSCNGLLLCPSHAYNKSISPRISYGECNNWDHFSKSFICNPTSKQFQRLHFPDTEFVKSVVSLSLAFDCLTLPHYKVVLIRCTTAGSNLIDVNSSETDSLHILEIIFDEPDGFIYEGVYCNGPLHWCSDDETSLYFDVEKELLKEMPMSLIDYDEESTIKYFGKYQGHLHMVVTDALSLSKLDVWEMATDYSGWSLRYCLNLNSIKSAFPGLDLRLGLSLLTVVRADKEEEPMIVLFLESRAMAYFYDGISKKLCDLEPFPKRDFKAISKIYYQSTQTFQYFESLVSV